MILMISRLVLKCIGYWPEDGRPYVALGKILTKQTKLSEARIVYEKGCQATQGENAYIWQVCSFIFDFRHFMFLTTLLFNLETHSVGLCWRTDWGT